MIIKPQHGRRVLDQGERGNRVTLALTDQEIEQLDDWLHHHRLLTRSEAIRTLMRLGYKATIKTGRQVKDRKIGGTIAGWKSL